MTLPALLPGWGTNTACLGKSTCTACTPPGLRVSTTCLGMNTWMTHRWSHLLCWPPLKLRLTPLRTLRRSHQQATPMLDSHHRPEEESPTELTTTEAETNSPQNPEKESPVGNPDWDWDSSLPGKECLHSFPAGGLVLPAWEWVPALYLELDPTGTHINKHHNVGCGGLEKTESTDFLKDLASKFCMLHEFKEPTMPTATEAEADSPQNPEEESPVGNPQCKTPLADQRRSHQLCRLLQKY